MPFQIGRTRTIVHKPVQNFLISLLSRRCNLPARRHFDNVTRCNESINTNQNFVIRWALKFRPLNKLRNGSEVYPTWCVVSKRI